ncbi:MAG: glycosyltransferase family 2 protein [Desulfobulbaceae bacterium]|nr:glycosyltransferase family 2 protein [Desulfobulbaceae bacterium]
MMTYLFWITFGGIAYAYGGYTLLLWIFAGFVKENRPGPQTYKLPTVSLIISAYNEEDVIEEKILNTLSLDYPDDLLEINIVSDGSTDGTNEISARYRHKGLKLLVYEGRIGKTACLNKAVPLCSGEIIIFSDANSMYDGNAVKELVRNFQYPAIGLVTGWTKYLSGKNTGTESTGLYTKIEILTKKLETRLGSCIGADGAIFAIRRNLYQPLSDHDINDFVIPLNVLKKDFRVVLEPNAFCYEQTADDSKGEFARQVRITNRTLRALFNYKELLNPLRYPVISFKIISHKYFKFLTPCFLIILLAANVLLLSHGFPYQILLVGQLLLYCISLSYYFFNENFQNRILALGYSFVLVNIAYLMGWIKYLTGESYSTWQPERKAR